MEAQHPWNPHHAQCPERISVCFKRMTELGLVDRCVRIPSRYAAEAEIAELHSVNYLEDVRKSEAADENTLEKLCVKYSTHFSKDIYNCALLAAGSSLNLLDAIISGRVHNGMAIIRPPGHHASFDFASGYCFFNNAALVANRALKRHGLRRILIVDWDAHHGQGTQRLFYNSREVLYISMHRYEHGDFWPSLRESDWDFIGAGKGRGFNVNIPLNRTGMGDSEYLAMFHQIIVPLAREYCPELVICSAGFDSCLGDPEGEMLTTPACFAHMTHCLRQFANGKLCVLLEGGYHLKSLAESASATLGDLLADPCPTLPGGPLVACHTTVTRTLLLLERKLRPFWPNVFAYQGTTTSADARWESWLAACRKHRTKVNFEDEYNPRPENLWTKDEDTGLQTAEDVAKFDKLIDKLLLVPRPVSTYTRMFVVVSDGDAMLLHKQQSHPECPERYISIVDRLRDTKILGGELEEKGIVRVIKSRPATKDEVLFAHTADHVEEVFALPNMSVDEVNDWAYGKNSLYASPDSLTSALHAAGGLVDAVDAVVTGKSVNSFAVIRPPGHHANSVCSAGFCLFNSVAIAAQAARKKYQLERILIVDWDVHFGDGTSEIFYEDRHILYISLHRFDNGYFYPGKAAGNYDYVGKGNGKGFNVNIPWCGGRMGPSEYLAAFERIVMPIAYEFNPELVFVSAGFDAAVGDPLGCYAVTPEAYAAMTLYLSALAGGRLVVALEGGYNLKSISDAAEACCRSLLGLSPAFNISSLDKVLRPAVETISAVLDVQAEFWNTLSPFRVSLPLDDAEERKPVSKNVVVKKQKTPSPVVVPADVSPTNQPPPPPMQTPVLPSAGLASSAFNEEELAQAFQRVDIGGSWKEKIKESSNIPRGVVLALGLPGAASDEQGDSPEGVGYLVDVRPTCPHVDSSIRYKNASDLPSGVSHSASCNACSEDNECWICLTCLEVGCGRYRSGHGLEHFKSASKHCLAFSLADFSLWCYVCEAYIDAKQAGPVYEAVYQQRFGSLPP